MLPEKSKMTHDRRKNPRFQVRDNAFAIFKSEPTKPLPIVDISLGGLAISVNAIHVNVDGFSDASRLEILTDDCRFYMDKLPYQLILPQRNFAHGSAGSFQNIFGVQFIDLMSSQRSRLNHFIRKHTRSGMAPKLVHRFNQHLHQFIGQKKIADACRNIWLQRPSI